MISYLKTNIISYLKTNIIENLHISGSSLALCHTLNKEI